MSETAQITDGPTYWTVYRKPADEDDPAGEGCVRWHSKAQARSDAEWRRDRGEEADWIESETRPDVSEVLADE